MCVGDEHTNTRHDAIRSCLPSSSFAKLTGGSHPSGEPDDCLQSENGNPLERCESPSLTLLFEGIPPEGKSWCG